MSERPRQLKRLDRIQSAAGLAHQSIFDMHRLLLGRDHAQAESTALLSESAQIATAHVPRLIAPLKRLGARWDEENLLDPTAADRTARELAAELATLEPEIASHLGRQREIAARLRDLLGP